MHASERFDPFVDFSQTLAKAAASVSLPLFRQADLDLQNKAKPGAYDPVTKADKAAEAAIRALISKHYPDHGVIGEEYGEDRPEADFVWVLDPIDGTRAFVAGLPLWTTLIALRYQGVPVLGLIAQPVLDEVYVGTSGVAGPRAFVKIRGEESPIRVRSCAALTDVVLATTDQNLFSPAEMGAFEQVRVTARLTRYGCDAYAFARLAAGSIDMVIETGLKAWDIDCAIPLIEGAGGVVSNWSGNPIGPDGGQVILAGDRACWSEALTALRRSAHQP